MAIATHVMNGRARTYPCPKCFKQHPSNTTCLDVIGSSMLTGWTGRVSTKKLLMFTRAIKPLVTEEIFKSTCTQVEKEWDDENNKQGKSASYFWHSSYEITKEAADIGTVTHAAIEMFLLGKQVDKKSLPPKSLLAFEAFLDFHSKNEMVTNNTERTSYNCQMGYAGTSDWDGLLNGKLTKGEWKTSTGIFEKNPIQVWANVISDEMDDGSKLYEQVFIGRFGKDGSFEKLIIPRRGLDETGFCGYEQARVLIQACVPWFHFKQGWENKFPYQPKIKKEQL